MQGNFYIINLLKLNSSNLLDCNDSVKVNNLEITPRL